MLRVGPKAWLGLAATLALGVTACDRSGNDLDASEERTRKVPDATLHTHIVAPGEPTAEGLAYLRAVGDVHGRADEATGAARIRILRRGLAVPVPAGLAEAEIVRLDLAARLGEELNQTDTGSRVARDLLSPLLRVEKSLPLDRATARALVVLGDAAAQTGDDALAAGSYARAIEMMSLMRQELEP